MTGALCSDDRGLTKAIDTRSPYPRRASDRGCRFLVFLCVAAGCGGMDSAPLSVDGWRIAVDAPAFTEKVAGDAAAGSTASATFTAQGTGMRGFGACLLVDVHGAKACDTAADCATGAVVPLAEGHFEYCVAAEGESQTFCWTRNAADADWCNKVPPPGRMAGTYATPAADAAHLQGSGSKTRWLTLACLNAGTYPTFSDGPRPPCASSDPVSESYSLHVASRVSTFTAP